MGRSHPLHFLLQNLQTLRLRLKSFRKTSMPILSANSFSFELKSMVIFLHASLYLSSTSYCFVSYFSYFVSIFGYNLLSSAFASSFTASSICVK